MNSNLVYDVGMHNGDDTAYYLSLGYNVVAIEASPALVANAKRRFEKAISENRLDILNIGIDSDEGEKEFYLNKTDSVWNSFHIEIGKRGMGEFESIRIKTNSLDNILRDKGTPYYLKIDIEGNDILCLRALQKIQNLPNYVSVELSGMELIEQLYALGYHKFKIIEQSSLLPLEIPPAKDYKAFLFHKAFQHSMKLPVRIVRKLFGNYINRVLKRRYTYKFSYNHPHGSSGPFGERLTGKWLDFREALKVYDFYKNDYHNKPGNVGYGFWVDIHATIEPF